MSTGAGRVRRALGVLAVVVAALGLGAAPAAAHDALVGTSPADGSTVATAPDRVELTFAEPALPLGTQVAVTGPDGTAVALGDVQIAGTTVVQELVATRPAGRYTVDWRVTSADGHPVTGTFTFTASAPTPAASPAPSAPTAAPSTAVPTPGVVTPTPGRSADTVVGSPPTAVPPAAPTGGRPIVGVLVLVLVVLGLVATRIGRARSLRGARAPAGPDGPAGGA